ncbi:hypothetical protein ACFQXA_05385 [Nocardiopsis composta]
MAYDRPPAPEDLEPVESFCDSARFLYGEDSFADVASARSWLRDHGHAAAADALDRAGLGVLAEVREAVRGHLEGDAGARRRLTAAAADLLGSPAGRRTAPWCTRSPRRTRSARWPARSWRPWPPRSPPGAGPG